MEFWSGIIGALVGGAIALVGTIFSVVYTHRCQRDDERHKEKKRIYADICGILGGFATVEIIVELDKKQHPIGTIDTTNFTRVLDELSVYMNNHSGEIMLYVPSEIHSALMRIRGDIYQMTIIPHTNLDADAAAQLFLDSTKTVSMKVFALQNKIKNDLYPTNPKNKKGR